MGKHSPNNRFASQKSHNVDFLNIPIPLCRYSIENHLVVQLKVYCALKCFTSGHFHLTTNLLNALEESLTIKPRSTKIHLKWLLENKWLALNNKTGSFRIPSFHQTCCRLNLKGSWGAIFYPEDFYRFSGFVYAAFITYSGILKCITDRSNAERTKPERLVGRSSKSLDGLFVFDLPHSYLAKILGISKDRAVYIRKTAIISGFIKSFKSFQKIDADIQSLKFLNKLEKHLGNTDSGWKVVRNGHCFLQNNDDLTSSIKLRRKKTLQNAKNNTEEVDKSRIKRNTDALSQAMM
jgi:hypothetical protein